jgi:transcriptional regulator with XRE-family HTH domain
MAHEGEIEPADPKALGERVKAERKARGWSQPKLAKLAKLSSYQHVSSIERGERRRLAGKTLVGLATAFGMQVEELLGPAEDPPALRLFLESDAGRDCSDAEKAALRKAPLFLGSTPSAAAYGALLLIYRSEKARR